MNKKPRVKDFEKIDYGNVYYWLHGILLYFLEDGYLEFVEGESFELRDLRTIKRFINENADESTKQVIEDGCKVLTLSKDNFPQKWITQIGDRYCEDEEDCRRWLSWIVDNLEQELKKKVDIGKPFELLCSLLLCFLQDQTTNNTDTETTKAADMVVMKRFADINPKEYVKEGEELLALEKFPEEWVINMTHRKYRTTEECRNWLSWVISEVGNEWKKKHSNKSE